MKYKYIGDDERVIPALGLTVKPGDEFDAPAGFKAHNVVDSNSVPTKETNKPTVSAASDLKAGE